MRILLILYVQRLQRAGGEGSQQASKKYDCNLLQLWMDELVHCENLSDGFWGLDQASHYIITVAFITSPLIK